MRFEPTFLIEPGGRWGPAGLPHPIPFIKRVRLSNYRSIRACDVRLDPLTVLVGPNGSGKSNFVDALAFLGEAVMTSPELALESRGGLRRVCSRVPGPTDRFAICVEAQIPWGPLAGQMPTARYGFELAANDAPGERPFVVSREQCHLVWEANGGGEMGFSVTRGEVQRFDPAGLSPAGPASFAIEPARLYLAQASASPSYAPLYALISNMAFYNLELGTLQSIQPESMGDRVGPRGEHLGDVIGALALSRREANMRVQEYLRAVTSGLSSFDRHYEGSYVTVAMRAEKGSNGTPAVFSAQEISDGTLHAAGVLVALFQPSALEGRIPLVGIEEPEVTLHPAAAGVLFDAMAEASGWVQVLATSHSGDLLDRDDFPTDAIRAVVSDDGRTVIGPIDEAGRKTLRDKLFTAGELLRGDQLAPDDKARDLADSADFDVFGD